ncbi:hypothetical protein P8S54_04715 [Thiomicrospira sp. R3]|uniref:hypothetical protein n=1 Tax=Thiomicrospira sp. R3 TaxID=3035472 RepID=UPI00259B379A|nr:hypothetical protein [Thiomicrospira sp. R3]WFE69607.1 hypothetical protein P8S54_04715 [Thiomicrospira sp. R3]
MSEPITPKANQHAVEGEFIEADKEQKIESPEKQASTEVKKTQAVEKPRPSTNNQRSFLLTLVIMLVSGGALATALATWLQLQPVLHSLAAEPISHHAEPQGMMIERVIEKIAYQQSQIQQIHQELQAQQGQAQQFEQQFAAVEVQLNEMQLHLVSLSETFAQTRASMPQADKPVEIDSNGLDSSLSSVIQTEDPSLRRDLNQLRSQLDNALEQINRDLQQLNQQSKESLAQFNDYVNSEQWQQDKARLQSQLQGFNEQLGNLADQQQEWIERVKPQIEQTLEEVTPQLEGFLSIFNQLFSIKKHTEDEQ